MKKMPTTRTLLGAAVKDLTNEVRRLRTELKDAEMVIGHARRWLNREDIHDYDDLETDFKDDTMSGGHWERLSEDTEETCNKDKWGWSDTDTGRCGKKAEWIKRDTCGCGAVNMVIRHCGPHQEAYLAEKKRIEEWGKKNVEEIKGLPPGIVGYRRKR